MSFEINHVRSPVNSVSAADVSPNQTRMLSSFVIPTIAKTRIQATTKPPTPNFVGVGNWNPPNSITDSRIGLFSGTVQGAGTISSSWTGVRSNVKKWIQLLRRLLPGDERSDDTSNHSATDIAQTLPHIQHHPTIIGLTKQAFELRQLVVQPRTVVTDHDP